MRSGTGIGVLVAAAAGAGTAVGAYSRLIEPRRLDITRHDIPIPRLPRELDGLRIAVVGDIHLGMPGGRAWTCPALDAAIEAVNGADADVLAFVGDVGYKSWGPEEAAAAVDRFQAPCRVAVLGNHDYSRSTRAERLSCLLSRRGFLVLANEAREVRVRRGSMWVAGLADSTARRANVPDLLESIPHGAAPVLLVTHTPDGVREMPAGAFDLAVAGHTHGGQIAIPFLESLIVRKMADSAFNRGIYRVVGTPMFVTRGLGMVGIHARFCSRPEVALLDLHGLPVAP